jgi:hypothetical protein
MREYPTIQPDRKTNPNTRYVGIGEPRLSVTHGSLTPSNLTHSQARGALLRGLDGSIVRERRSRRFYGCDAHGPYEAGKGLEDHMFWSESDDVWRVKDEMQWYVKRVCNFPSRGRLNMLNGAARTR